MSRVDFYILPDGETVERFACSVTAKAWRSGNRVHIHTANADEANTIDDMLWTFRDISFVPHEVLGQDVDEETPVTIGHGNNYPPDTDVLVNLDRTIPEFSSAFTRIVEIVGGSEEKKKNARQRYRDYRNGSFDVHDHKIEPAA